MDLSICSMAWVNHENGKNVPLILAVLFICGNIMVWWKSSSITGLCLWLYWLFHFNSSLL